MALQGDQVIGYISGYFRPQKPGTLFVWQVAVSSSARGKGLAKSMLESILQRGKSKIQKVETTISPSNRASQKLFESFAKQLGRPLEKETFLSGKDFPAEGHEAEDLYHFPFSKGKAKKEEKL